MMLFTPASSTFATTSASTSSSLVVAAITTAVSTVTTDSSNDDARRGDDNGECHLLGPFALIIQGSLGLLALLSLVFKRWRERPQRPVKIWAFDASKQVVGSALLHVANLLMSMLSSGQLAITITTAGDYQANPCSFYLLNLAIDVSNIRPCYPSLLSRLTHIIHDQTTIGIPILIVLLRLLTHAFSLTPMGEPPESIQSGHYGRPPKYSWWLKQSFIYFLGLLGMKFCVFVIFQLCPWIIRVGNWALRWTEDNEMVQLFFVMLFFPVVMNALQYYIIDNFIKNQKPSDHEQIPSEDEDEEDIDDRRRSEGLDFDGSFDSASDDEDTKRAKASKTAIVEDKELKSDKHSTRKKSPKKHDEYDPATDGERSGNGVQGNQEDGSVSPKKATTEGQGF
ncbi:hypothetical protein MMC07_002245 [Pseudocyphellaria aurata]|nr:hypothetical protein [Pseudocyphellaria aurata]